MPRAKKFESYDLVFFEVLEQVMVNGQVTLTYEAVAKGYTARAEFYNFLKRLREPVEDGNVEPLRMRLEGRRGVATDLAEASAIYRAACNTMLRLTKDDAGGATLEIVSRATSPVALALREALDKAGVETKAGPSEDTIEEQGRKLMEKFQRGELNDE